MMDLSNINKRSTGSKIDGNSSGQITIISARQHVVSGITTQLRINGGYNKIAIINLSFTDDFEDSELTKSDYAIIDIESFRDIAEIQRKVKYLIPVTARKIFIGDTDSISFNDDLKRIGVYYLHIDSQLMQLGTVLRNAYENNEETDQTQRISIIGCKGGSGASLIAWRLFQSIGKLSHLPVLLVQGHTGSADLDLISDVAIQRDGVITPVNTHQALKIAPEEEQWKFDDPVYKTYNIVIFDYTVTTQVRDTLAVISPASDFIFIVVTRELSSVRNARLILDELERNASSKSGEYPNTSKNIIVLNDIVPARASELSDEDIENFLSRKIDINSPYKKDIKKIDYKNDLHTFTATMLGKNLSAGNKRKGFRLSGFLKKK